MVTRELCEFRPLTSSSLGFEKSWLPVQAWYAQVYGKLNNMKIYFINQFPNDKTQYMKSYLNVLAN